jgi:hypothetical protein
VQDGDVVAAVSRGIVLTFGRTVLIEVGAPTRSDDLQHSPTA